LLGACGEAVIAFEAVSAAQAALSFVSSPGLSQALCDFCELSAFRDWHFQRFLPQLAALPGIESIGAASPLPFSHMCYTDIPFLYNL
jgi:hypothetical protein